jgi:hypothetical protein
MSKPLTSASSVLNGIQNWATLKRICIQISAAPIADPTKFWANDWVQLRELLNKVWDLANLIKARFSHGYAKTVVLNCF